MAPSMTNTVRVVLPPGADAVTMQLKLQGFGEILSVSPEGGEVEAVFFDVRAASLAAAELGCAQGPQRGARSVTLAGDALFDAEDVEAISGASAGEDGAHILEFFDIRVAARYGAREADAEGDAEVGAPPGLALPPVEAEMLQEPPMLPCKVLVCGLPYHLATKHAAAAIVQEAGLGYFMMDVGVRGGRASREVVITLTCAAVAELCATYFQCGQWACFGADVTAKVLYAGEDKPSRKTRKGVAEPCGRTRLSSAAPFFQPAFYDLGMLPQGEADGGCSSEASAEPAGPSTLSAEAAVFVPGAGASAPWAKAMSAVASDASTEGGDSEEERESPVAGILAGWA